MADYGAFTNSRGFVVEKRKADGSLDFSEPQPPFLQATVDDLAKYFYRMNPDSPNVTMQHIEQWFNSQGFRIRNKTW